MKRPHGIQKIDPLAKVKGGEILLWSSTYHPLFDHPTNALPLFLLILPIGKEERHSIGFWISDWISGPKFFLPVSYISDKHDQFYSSYEKYSARVPAYYPRVFSKSNFPSALNALLFEKRISIVKPAPLSPRKEKALKTPLKMKTGHWFHPRLFWHLK